MRTNIKNFTKIPSIRAMILVVLAFILALSPTATTYADNFDDQINALKNEVSQFEAEAGRLRSEANTLQNQLQALDSQRSALQTQITANELKLQQLNQQIEDTQLRITNQKEALGRNLRSMYLENSVSSLEMVASSKSISDFIDKQEYRNKIRESIQLSLREIKTLKEQLDAQKKDVEHVLADQTTMRDQLAAQEAEKNNLLAQTQGQESAYQQLAGQKNKEIDDLRAKQRAANSRFIAGSGPACGGGYPGVYCNAPMDSIVDKWGMYNRECVSYAAFKVEASGRYMPYWGGRGNANQWDDSARADGIAVDSNPRVGDVAIWNIGYYGHAMYVEAVHGDGTITISQYNADWNGTYSTNRISASGLEFIHF